MFSQPLHGSQVPARGKPAYEHSKPLTVVDGGFDPKVYPDPLRFTPRVIPSPYFSGVNAVAHFDKVIATAKMAKTQ